LVDTAYPPTVGFSLPPSVKAVLDAPLNTTALPPVIASI